MKATTAFRFAVVAAVALAIALLPFGLSDYNRTQGSRVAVWFIAIIALNLVTGYTGQISIGHGAFMALGAYATAILTHDHGWNTITTLPIAALVGFGAGVVVGLPALRFHGVYLALATFAVALAVPQLATNYSHFTGGVEGLPLPQHTGFWLYGLGWSVAAIAFVATWFLLRGRTGRAFRAVRDSEVAAASSGVGLALHKTLAFGISAAIAGVGGSVLVLANTFINPDIFGLQLSLYILIGAVVAGLGSLWGTLAGACFVQLLPNAISNSSAFSAQSVPVIFGAIVILAMAVVPGGFAELLVWPVALSNRIRSSHSQHTPQRLEAR